MGELVVAIFALAWFVALSGACLALVWLATRHPARRRGVRRGTRPPPAPDTPEARFRAANDD